MAGPAWRVATMEIQPVWIEETRVKTYETDFQRLWRPASFFQALQEAAAHHADHLGVGYHNLLSEDQMWILSRVRIRFHAFPGVDERVQVQTWPKGLQQRLLFMRYFHLARADGTPLADASTAWLLVSPSTRRILKPAALNHTLPENAGQAAIHELLDKLSPPAGLPERLTVTANYSAIDQVGHVSNWRYIEWITDAFSLEEHAAQHLQEIQINFTKEVQPGQQMTLLAGPDGSDGRLWWVEGVHQADGTRAFEAFLRFAPL
jgi:medium-chain acyl-[acyl-carrier-protein] hydrolase